MNWILRQQKNTNESDISNKRLLALCLLLSLFLTSCGGSDGSSENTADHNQNIIQDYLFFIDQSPEDNVDIYRVATGKGHSLIKLNTIPITHFFKTYLMKNIGTDQQKMIEAMVWLENGQILSSRSDSSTVTRIAQQALNQTFCSIDSPAFFNPFTYDPSRQNRLIEAGEDGSCDSTEDNPSYLFELEEDTAFRANEQLIWGHPFLQLDESGTPTVYAYRYVDEDQKTIVFNTKTREVVAEYPFEVPYHHQNLFKINGWLFAFEGERLARISLSDLKNGTLDIEASYIPLNRNVDSDRLGALFMYGRRLNEASDADLVDELPSEPVYLVGMNDVKTLNLRTGEVSAPVIFTHSFSYYPHLRFLETPGLAHVPDLENHYFVDVNTGQTDLVLETPYSARGYAYHDDLLLLSEVGTGAYVLGRSGVEHYFPDATWQEFYNNTLDRERYILLLTETSSRNDHEASIQIVDKNDFSIVRNLGSYVTPYHNIRNGFRSGVGYTPGRYQLVTDYYRSQVFFLDLLTENSLTYLMSANGQISL